MNKITEQLRCEVDLYAAYQEQKVTGYNLLINEIIYKHVREYAFQKYNLHPTIRCVLTLESRGFKATATHRLRRI